MEEVRGGDRTEAKDQDHQPNEADDIFTTIAGASIPLGIVQFIHRIIAGLQVITETIKNKIRFLISEYEPLRKHLEKTL